MDFVPKQHWLNERPFSTEIVSFFDYATSSSRLTTCSLINILTGTKDISFVMNTVALVIRKAAAGLSRVQSFRAESKY